MKSLPLAPLAAGAVLLFGVLHSFDASAASPSTILPGPARTLDLSIVPKTISEPGLYVVDRNWDLRNVSSGAPGTTTLTITANNVAIDFRGYQILFAEYGIGVKIKGSNVTLHGGSLVGGNYSSTVRSSGAFTVLDHMSIYSFDIMQLTGSRSEMRDSDFDTKSAVLLGNDATVVRSRLVGRSGPIQLGNNDRVVGNEIVSEGDGVVTVLGNGNVFADNSIGAIGGAGYRFVVNVTGNGNVVLRNTVTAADAVSVINVNGTGNTIDANVARPIADDRQPSAGVTFRQAGNFYGNNRMRAQLPYDLGGLPQTDWGGNVGY